MKISKNSFVALTVAAALSMPLQIYSAGVGAAALEEVVVTARKRDELLQDIPISMVAIGSQELEHRNITSLSDLRTAVPDLSIVGGGFSNNNVGFYIRGVGQADGGITMEPGVGVYVDGVYRARLQGSDLGLLDINSIEVLRGPQGTLYGRNTIGGAVNVSSSKPGREPALKMSAGLGDYDLFRAKVIGDMPLIEDVLYSRLALGVEKRDGYSENIDTGEDGSNKDYLGARLDVEYVATDDLLLTFRTNWSQRQEKSPGAQCIILDQSQVNFFDSVFGAGINDACLRASSSGKFKFARDLKSLDDNENQGASITADWAINPGLLLKSITAFQRTEWQSFEDVDATALSIVHAMQQPSHSNQWSQEFQLKGDSMDRQLNWIAGIYAQVEDIDRPQVSDVGLFNLVNTRDRGAENKSYAAFGQATYDLSTDWSFTLGGRYTYEERYFEHESMDLINDELIAAYAIDDSFDDFNPLISVSYKPKSNLMTYLSWSTGFKSGGFNSRPDPAVPSSLEPFQPETVETLELGIKSSWFEDRFILNFAVYDSDYENMQLVVFDSTPEGDFVSLIQNAGEARIRGIEFDFVAAISERWKISGGYGLIDSEYRIFDSLDPSTGEVNDLSDLDLPNTPRNTGNISAEWSLPLVGSWIDEALFRIDYSYTGSKFNDVSNTKELEIDSYELVNSNLSIYLNNHQTEVRLWGKNLTDEYYKRNGVSLEDSFGIGSVIWAEPRTYGVSITHEF